MEAISLALPSLLAERSALEVLMDFAGAEEAEGLSFAETITEPIHTSG